MQIEMRQATADDINFLWHVFRVSMEDYITQTRGEWNEQREEAQFRNQLDWLTTQVVHANNLAVGFIMAPIKDGARWIHTICIVPEHQHKGIGTEVLGRVIAHAKEQKMPLYLGVLKVNPYCGYTSGLDLESLRRRSIILRCGSMAIRTHKLQLAENVQVGLRAFADFD